MSTLLPQMVAQILQVHRVRIRETARITVRDRIMDRASRVSIMNMTAMEAMDTVETEETAEATVTILLKISSVSSSSNLKPTENM